MTFSIENAIWLKESESPKPSASSVAIPSPTEYPPDPVDVAVPTGLSAAGLLPDWLVVPKPTAASGVNPKPKSEFCEENAESGSF